MVICVYLLTKARSNVIWQVQLSRVAAHKPSRAALPPLNSLILFPIQVQNHIQPQDFNALSIRSTYSYFPQVKTPALYSHLTFFTLLRSTSEGQLEAKKGYKEERKLFEQQEAALLSHPVCCKLENSRLNSFRLLKSTGFPPSYLFSLPQGTARRLQLQGKGFSSTRNRFVICQRPRVAQFRVLGLNRPQDGAAVLYPRPWGESPSSLGSCRKSHSFERHKTH